MCLLCLHESSPGHLLHSVMHPRIWGRDMWRSIHYVALGYPVRDPAPEVRQSYLAFFGVLGSVLPCAKCSQHYNEHIASYPVDPSLVGRAELFRWTIDLHNAVNISLGRESWTYEHAYEIYADRRSPQDSRDRSGLGRGRVQIATKLATLTISALFVVALFLWMRRRHGLHNRHS